MSKALTWSHQGTGRSRADIVTLVLAVALHASALVLLQRPSQNLQLGVELLNAPELEMAQLDQPASVEPPPQPAASPGPDTRAPKPLRSPPEEVPVKEVSEGTPKIESSQAIQQQAIPVAPQRVLVDESGKGAAFNVRTSGVPRARPGRPRAPKYPAELDRLVLRNYPRYARSEGIESSVMAHVRLSAGGKVLNVRVADVSDDGWGFGEACARSIHQLPTWQPRLDERGNPIATVAVYACRFVNH